MKEKIIRLLEQHRNAKAVYEELGLTYQKFIKLCLKYSINYYDYIFIYYDDYIGQILGKLLIEGFDGKYCNCLCLNCNKKTKILKWKIDKNSHPISCQDCALNQSMENNKNWTGYKLLTGHQFAQWRTGAKRRNIQFDITPEQVWNIFDKNNNLCPITEEKLIFRNINPKLKINSNISIDRINNKDSYNKDNILIVHKDFNKFHHTYNLSYVLQMSKLITNPEINIGNKISIIPKWYLTQIVNNFNARKNIQDYNLCENDLIHQFNKQNGICYYAGLILNFGQKQKDRIYQTASLDRLDNTKGYTIDNIVWCHKHINLMKKDLTVERFKFIAEKTVVNLPKIIHCI